MIKTVEEIAYKCGFTHIAPINIPQLEFLQEVRDMCISGQCGNYNKSWSCPPACASLEEMRERVKTYTHGFLVQTVSDIEDSYDWEGMMAAEAQQKRNFKQMWAELKKEYRDILALGSGACKICEPCTYPDNPCRFPNKIEVSMEASGLFVSKVCKDNGLAYNYGSNKIAFTSCFFVVA